MSISEDKFKEILSEEVSLAVYKNPEIEQYLVEGFFKDMFVKGGTAAGMALLQSMMSTKSGRANLADILVAIPEFIKTHICDAGNLIRDQFKMEGGFSRVVATTLSLLCRGVTNVSLSPLYAASLILRKISDETAAKVVQEAGKARPPNKKDPAATQNDAPGDDGLPRSNTPAPNTGSPDIDSDSAWEDIPGFGKVAERNNTLKYLRVIRENELINR
jgi:hypothetical protein